METKKFVEPQIMEAVTGSEPVETGCCLRSCGGSPHHLNSSVGDEALAEKLSEIS